jgi:hypothetical protein
MNTVGAAASSADAYMYLCLCTYIMLYCICLLLYMYYILLGPQNQHLVYKIAQYIMQIFIFLKMSCFQTRRFNRGNTWMRYVVSRCLAGWSACLSLIFCRFLVGASSFVVRAPRLLSLPWLRAAHVFRLLLWVQGKILNYVWFCSCCMPYADNVADRKYSFWRILDGL